VFGEDALPDLIDAGIDCIEHGTGLSTDLIDRMVERQTALVPTVVQLENFPSYALAGEGKFPTYAAHIRDLYARRSDTLRAAHEAGVSIYAGTDAGGVLPHGLIADEIRGLTEIVGMSPEEALSAASWGARSWLGRTATLEEGAPADLVVYDADPRADLATLKAPRRILLRGSVVG
jgi:imidazolonepropionase-like amidohydrolase